MRYMKLLVATLAVCTSVCMAQQSLNNDSIVRMHTAGLGDDVIILAIQNQAGTYSTTTDGLIALKTAGLSDKVIGAMITKSTAGSQSATNPAPDAAAPAQPAASPAAESAPPAAESAPPVAPPQPQPAAQASQQKSPTPWVLIKSESGGTTVNAKDKDQAMQMATDFGKVCPGVAITVLADTADYEVILNHVETGLLSTSNQTTLAYKTGVVVTTTKGTIDGDAKKLCPIILADYAKR